MPIARPAALVIRSVANPTPASQPPAPGFSCIRSSSPEDTGLLTFLPLVRQTPFKEFGLLFRVRCPRCGQTAEITEAQLGRQGQCNNCGSLVAIPARLSKVCFVCGIDVTPISHTKDEQGNYLCSECFARRQPSEQLLFSTPKLECSICHVRFPREEGKHSPTGLICRDCAAVLAKEQAAEGTIPFASDAEPLYEPPRASPPAPKPIVTPSRSQFEEWPESAATALSVPPPQLHDLEQIKPTPRRAPMPQFNLQTIRPPTPPFPVSSKLRQLPLILSSLALAGVVILAIVHYSAHVEKEKPAASSSSPQPNLDQETLTRVLVLKGQAEVLIQVGKIREGIEKYDVLLRIQSSNPTITAEQDSAKSAREKALKLLAAATTTQHGSEDKPAPAPEAQKKPGTIFNE